MNLELTLSTVAGIDVILLASSAALLFRYGKISLSHPATTYLFAHAFMVTARTLQILSGSPTCFSSIVNFSAVTEGEILRAVVYCDVALVGMTVTWLIVASRQVETGPNEYPNEIRFDPNIARPIAFTAAAIGLSTMIFHRTTETMLIAADTSDWERSSWVMLPQIWIGLACLCLIYWYGGRLWLMLPLLVYFLDVAMQGYSRCRLILPAFLLALIYLDRKKLKWPPISVVLVLMGLGMLFFPLKAIGRAIQRGGSIEELVEDVQENYSKLWEEGGSGDALMLDTLAIAITSIEEYGSYFCGTIYFPLITVVIPRPWWPDKPGLNDWIAAISTADRPVWECGMAPTLLGESYANFGLLGILLIPCMWAYGSGRIYFWAYRHSNSSLARFAYLVFACNFIQVYRDGLITAFVFPVIFMMPMTVVILCHFLARLKPGASKADVARI